MDLLNRFRIGAKISAVILVVMVLTGMVAGVGLVSLNQAHLRLDNIVDVSAEKVNLASTLGRNLIEVVRAEKNLILAETPSELDTYQYDTMDRLGKISERRAALDALVNADELAMLEQFDEHWQEYETLNQQVRQLVLNGEVHEAVALSRGAARSAVNAALDDMKAIIAKTEAEMEADKESLDAAIGNARLLMVATSVVALIVGLALGLVVAREIGASLEEVVSVAGCIARGDVSQTVDAKSRDETGELAAAFNRSIDYLKYMADVANQVAGGDLDVQVVPRSERDQLGIALQQMVMHLREVTTDNERRTWKAHGQAELSDQMRGDLSIPDLAQNIVTFLCHYLGAQVGGLYVNSQDGNLKLVGSYAYTRRKGLSDQFKIGEGLVGQAALEKKAIMISQVPADYIHIQSGLGESKPGHILVVPFILRDQVCGVIELGSFSEWTDAQLDFLESVTENMAIAYQALEARRRTEELLEKTQRQAEELQVQTEEMEAQQEELRQTNEELEQQTQALRESERELQTQQEELETTNEELTDKTTLLEKQRTAAEEQNRQLQTAQAELERRAQDLALASRYKSEFLSNMSHELRTPLNSMLILARMLADNEEQNLTQEQVESAKVICDSGQDLLALINDILDLAKVEAGRMEQRVETVSMAEFVEGMVRDFTPVAREKSLKFETELEDGLPDEIMTDRKRLGQIIKNLLSNAFKFTHEGGVTLSIHRPAPDTDHTHSGLEASGAIAFSVADTGIGIPPEHQQAVFEAFQQVDGSISRQYGGTGLGLSICRELSAFLGGEVALQSTPGQGSTFTLYLPQTAPPTPPPLPLPVPALAPLPEPVAPRIKPVLTFSIPDDREDLEDSKRVILIIEDDQRFAKIVADMAKARDFKVLIAPNGEAGLALAQTHQPTAVLLDLKLPGLSGWDVLTALKENPDTRHIPVHIMSAEAETLDAYRHGAIGYLTKPVDPSDLDRAFGLIEGHLERHFRTLLVVEDDRATRLGLVKLIDDGDIECIEAATGQEALEMLHTHPVDCMILDLRLPDMTGFELLDQLGSDRQVRKPPVIIYTGKELTEQENEHLIKYADTVIVKGVKSEERLLDETALFLHRVVADLPLGKQKIIRQLHDRDAVLAGRKVLLVDDDVRNAFALSRLLTERGLDVDIAADGQKALDMLAAQPDTDLVLMDVMLPVVDGLEVMRRIRQQPDFKSMPILAITAKAMKGDRDKCLEAGANDYISKPVDVDQLLSLLRVWLYR